MFINKNAAHRFANCAGCGARNYDQEKHEPRGEYREDLIEFEMGRTPDRPTIALTLCGTCADDLVEALTGECPECQSGDEGGHMNWCERGDR